MAFTALMFVVLIIAYVLMFGLVKFSENIIARPELLSADGNGTARAGEAEKTM